MKFLQNLLKACLLFLISLPCSGDCFEYTFSTRQRFGSMPHPGVIRSEISTESPSATDSCTNVPRYPASPQTPFIVGYFSIVSCITAPPAIVS
jgi:hypothetical protein